MTVEEYVPHIQKYFPYVIDTKILLNANPTFQSMLKKSSTSLSKAFAALCPQTDSGVKIPGLSHEPQVKVEVQVDDMRYAFLQKISISHAAPVVLLLNYILQSCTIIFFQHH